MLALDLRQRIAQRVQEVLVCRNDGAIQSNSMTALRPADRAASAAASSVVSLFANLNIVKNFSSTGLDEKPVKKRTLRR